MKSGDLAAVSCMDPAADRDSEVITRRDSSTRPGRCRDAGADCYLDAGNNDDLDASAIDD